MPFAQLVQALKQSFPSEQIHIFLFEDTPATYSCQKIKSLHSRT